MTFCRFAIILLNIVTFPEKGDRLNVDHIFNSSLQLQVDGKDEHQSEIFLASAGLATVLDQQ